MDENAGVPGNGPHVLPSRASWYLGAFGLGAAALSLLSDSPGFRPFVLDTLGLVAGGAAVYGIVRNQPARRGPWLLLAIGIALSAAGDVVWDLAIRGLGESDAYPWADLLYLAAYPCFAIALWRLAGRRRRDTTVDSAIVVLAAATVMWQWVLDPVIASSEGTTLERLVTVAYPLMDVVLVVAIVHAVFTLPRSITAARFLFAGLGVMLVADLLYARMVADGAYTDGSALDALWPIAYILMAAAALHPSTRELWGTANPGLVRLGRARVVVLAGALLCAPVVTVIAATANDDAIALSVLIIVTAALVAWRIACLVVETNRARVQIGESEARFRALVQHSTDGVAVLDGDGVVAYVSEPGAGMLGREPESLIGTNIAETVHPDDLGVVGGVLARLTARPLDPVQIEVRVRHADGAWRWLGMTCTNQHEKSAIGGVVSNFRDITNRKRIELAGLGETRVLELMLSGAPVDETLHALLEVVEEFVDDAAAIVRLVDPDTGRLRSIAAPTLPLSYIQGVDEDVHGMVDTATAVSQVLREPSTMLDISAEGTFPELRELASAHGLRSFWSFPIRSIDGGTFLGFVAVYTRTRRLPNPTETALIERARDLVSIALDRAAHTRQLALRALHDTLTELPNRAQAVERLEDAVRALPGSGPMLAVLFLDLDRFKVVNDSLGHDTGDELLVAVGQRLSGAIRQNDLVARFGGDEFVVICQNLRDERQAVEMAERALSSLALPFALRRAEVVVSASIGIAFAQHPEDRASDLLRDADTAMYRAKSRGGGRYELFDQAMHTQAVARLLTERGLRRSLENNELRLRFQPQFDLGTRRRVATEALLRWAHPVRGLMSPGDFIAVAEETGLIVAMGEWVVEEVCRHLEVEWHDGGGDGLAVSVNVSVRQLLHGGFVDHVRATLRHFELDPSALCVEIAERVLVDDQELIRDALHALKDLGVRLAVDDFGTGGSSLTYLRRYPFDELKIDGTFVAGLGRSAADDTIVAATIDMAHALGMTTAAEGIETEAQLERLVELGCERGQGFFLARPEPAAARHLRLVRTRTA